MLQVKLNDTGPLMEVEILEQDGDMVVVNVKDTGEIVTLNAPTIFETRGKPKDTTKNTKEDSMSKAKAKTKTKTKAPIKAKTTAKTKTKAPVKAKAVNDGNGKAKRGALSVDLDKYSKVKGSDGKATLDIGDDTAKVFRDMDINEQYSYASKVLGVTAKELRAKYQHLNPGMQRMNLGNRVRAALAKGDDTTKAPARAKAKTKTTAKAKAPAKAKAKTKSK